MVFRRILALTDLSENSVPGLTLAASLAVRLHAQVCVGYVHTRPEALRGFGGEDEENARRLADWVRDEDEEHLRDLARNHVDRLHLAAVESIDVRSVRDGIARMVERTTPDLICMSTHGRTGLRHLLLGSIAEHTIRTAEVPVLVTKGRPFPGAQESLRAMLCLDLVEDPLALAQRAVADLLLPGDDLLLAHVVESLYYSPTAYGSEFALPQPDIPALQGAAAERLEAMDLGPEGPRVRVEVGAGRPGEGLLGIEQSEQPHVTIARTHGRRGFDRMMLGSVSELLARRCRGAVLIYPKLA
jgi:nucleotide-binding universal stress UspA family protein